jgi:hypothetical protein
VHIHSLKIDIFSSSEQKIEALTAGIEDQKKYLFQAQEEHAHCLQVMYTALTPGEDRISADVIWGKNEKGKRNRDNNVIEKGGKAKDNGKLKIKAKGKNMIFGLKYRLLLL